MEDFMNLTNTQYNDIIRGYERIRLKNTHDLDSRIAEVYEKSRGSGKFMTKYLPCPYRK